MSPRSIEDFLGVKWYDGLLVKSDHFMHAGSRALSLFSEACAAAVDQPGILDIESQAPMGVQLVEVENIAKMASGRDIEISFNIMRPFRSLAPDGGIILALPNKKGYRGAPACTIVCRLSSASRELVKYFVLLKQDPKSELSVKKMYKPDHPIELEYPGLQVELAEEGKYRDLILSDYRSSTPVAMIHVEGDKAEMDASYIPPVVALKHVEFFNAGLVDSIMKLTAELSEVTLQYLAAGGIVFSREGVGPELRTRYNYYSVFNAMLLSKTGMLRNLPNFSPYRFFYEFMYPLSTWLDHYIESLGESRSSMTAVSEISAKIRGFSHTDLWMGTSAFLNVSRDFIYRVSETIREIG
jgi:hypothetical protein